MTAVLPAWKVELMEKKKKKVQDQKQHIESESVRKVSIPEWKRSLLEKRKDSPEAREQPSCVKSIFGPRIMKRSPQSSLSTSSVRQEPSDKDGDEMDKANILRDGALINNSSPGLGTRYTNSSVAKAVEFTSEMDHKTNKHHSQREKKICRDNTQQVETTETRSERNGIGESPQPESSVNYEHVKRPSDLRRLFEKSHSQVDKGLSRTQPAKRTESNDEQISKTAVETANAVEIVQNESQINKNAEDNAQSIRTKKLQVSSGAPSVGSKRNFASSQFIPKPYKSFVSTPPWLKNTTNRNVSFQVNGTKSVQENDLVGTGIQQSGVDSVSDVWQGAENDTAHSSSVNADRITKSVDSVEPITSQRTYWQETKGEQYSLMKESGSKEQEPLRYQNESNRELNKFIEKPHATENAAPVLENVNIGLRSASDTSTQDCIDASKSTKLHKSSHPVDESILHRLNSQGTTLLRYSLEKESDEEDQESFKPRKESENMKYTVIDRKSRQENVLKDGEEILLPSVNSVVHTTPGPPLELFSEHSGMDTTSSTSKSSIESLRSKFGPSGGFQKRYSSEENLLHTENKATQSSAGSTTLRQAHGIRPPPPMKRWSADVINLMSRDLDDDLANLSPTSDSKKSSPGSSFSRGRSSSLFDVHEESGMDFFQHKAGVSQGIEHRMNKLIWKASVSELHLHADDKEDSDSLSDDNEMPPPTSDITAESDVPAGNESAGLAKRSLAPAPEEQEIKEVFVHKRSISNDIEERVSELLHRQVSHSEGEGTEEEVISETESKVHSVHEVTGAREQSDNSEVVEVKENLKNDYTRSSDVFSSSKDTREADQNLSDSKPLKGSVHKLSALFGASIGRSSKKDKTGSQMKVKDNIKLQKDSTTEREESKISNLFTHKKDKKSSSTEKHSSIGSIFPWLKKNEMVKDVTKEQRTRNTDKAKDDNSNLDNRGNENLFLAAQNLRPVRKEKVEHKIVGNLVLISQGGTSQEHLPPKGVYHMNKPSSPASQDEQHVKKDVATTIQKEKVLNKPLDKEVEKKDKVQIPTVIAQQWNGKEERYEVHGEGTVIDEVPITSIDEVPVSAIDIPESADSDVTVSVIDVPASPDVLNTFFDSSTPEKKSFNSDVNVSVIDMPLPSSEEPPSSFQAGYLESDELSDDSNEDEIEGSYDFTTGESQHLVNGCGEDSSDGDEEEGSEEEEGDDDDDDDDFEDVPISYIGAVPRYPIPQVIFDSEPVQLKSCLSPKSTRKKVNSKVSFKSTHTVHDYPSEESAAVLHDELKEKTAELKTLQNYQPAGLASMEMMIGQLGKINTVKPHVTNGTEEGTVNNNNNNTNSSELKYADDGQAFTDSTHHASALLF